MRLKQSLIFALMISNLMPFAYVANAQEKSKPEWVFIMTDANHGWKGYYDIKNVTRTADGIVRIRVKQNPFFKDEEDKRRRMDELIKNREWLGVKTEGYDRYAYSVMELEINCRTNEGRSVSIVDHDDTDKELGRNTLERSEWAPITARSWIRMLAEELCTQKK